RETGGRIVDDASHAPGLATRPVERTEVSCKGCGSGNISGACGRVLTNIGLLKATEEEQFLPDDSAAERAAELVPLQAVLPRRKIIDGINITIPEELKNIAVPSIRSGFGDGVDHASRMQAVPGRQCAGLHAKLGQRIGKWKGHIHVRKAVVIVAAIEQVVGFIARATGNGNRL